MIPSEPSPMCLFLRLRHRKIMRTRNTRKKAGPNEAPRMSGVLESEACADAAGRALHWVRRKIILLLHAHCELDDASVSLLQIESIQLHKRKHTYRAVDAGEDDFVLVAIDTPGAPRGDGELMHCINI